MTALIYFDNLGYFALGAFVGTVTSHAIRFATDMTTSVNAIAVIIPAALGGTAMTFLQFSGKADHGMASYSMGLLIALMWVRAGIALDNIKADDIRLRRLGWAHLVSVVAASGFSAWLFVPGAISESYR